MCQGLRFGSCLQALRVIAQADGRLAAAYQPQHGIRIAAAQGPVVAFATGPRVECLLLDSGAGTLSPLAAWEFEQQVSAVAVLEVPDSQGPESEVSAIHIAAVAMLARLLCQAHTLARHSPA